MTRVIVIVLLLCGAGYGQLGAAVGGFNDAQERHLERKHQLQMQREAEQTALEIARRMGRSIRRRTSQDRPVLPSNWRYQAFALIEAFECYGDFATVGEVNSEAPVVIALNALTVHVPIDCDDGVENAEVRGSFCL
jgi:hypothetical protein